MGGRAAAQASNDAAANPSRGGALANLTVAVRVRPPSAAERKAGSTSCLEVRPDSASSHLFAATWYYQ